MSKIRIEDIRSEAESQGWVLISDTYTNLQTEITFKCPEGHLVLTTYGKWRGQYKCPICAANPLKDLDKKVISKKKDLIRIMALDQALNVTGWSVFDGVSLSKYGLIKMTHSDQMKKIHGVRVWLIGMIELWNPDKIILEDIQLQQFGEKNSNNVEGVTTYKALAWLQGALIDYLIEKDISYELVSPSTWRKHCKILGKTRSDKKKSAQLKVKEWYDIQVSNDEADAICLGKYGAESKERTSTMMSWE